MQDEPHFQFRAENGLLVRLRRLQASDAPCLVDLFEHLSSESRYLRFNIPLNNPDPEWVYQEATAMAQIDPEAGEGWLALADLPDHKDACVGGIRWLRTDQEGIAEVSLVVRDDLQGLGIGTEMIRFVGTRAYEQGVKQLIGLVQSTNAPLWRALKHMKIPIKRKMEGSYSYVEIDLPSAVALYSSPEKNSESET